MKHHTRIGATTAIAAALALFSTPLLAQEAQPVPTNPAPTTTTTEPAPETPPVTTDTTPSEPAATPDSTTTATTRSTTATHRTRVTTAKARPVAARTTTVTHRTIRTAAPAAAAAPVAARAAPPAPAPAAPTAAVNLAAKPAPVARPQPAQTPLWRNDTALEIGGGALALLALGGAAFAVSRRRRRRAEEEEWAYDEPMSEEPVAEAAPVETAGVGAAPRHDPVDEGQPAMAAPAASAFAWGDAPRSDEPHVIEGSATDDRNPGETWVERAYRGPTPANPSASLKHRLRRAAFFDKRERDVAAGKAEPVDTDAGLPDAAAEEYETA